MRGLGRLQITDSRDKDFLMASPNSERDFRNWLVPGEIEDQGETPHCVAHALSAWLRAHPVVNAHNEQYEIDRVQLYQEAQEIDQWPGTDYEGTSVRAGFKILQRRGFVESYRWAFNSYKMAHHVLEVGPVVVGSVWTSGMTEPEQGYIRPVGYSQGGHAYLITSAHMDRVNPDGSKGAFRIQNSWGPEWGDDGRAWISAAHMDAILRHGGEACTAIENRVRVDNGSPDE